MHTHIADKIYVHRSLWNMRNYIHVMLCSNLLIAQLLFVVGIEQTKYWVCGYVNLICDYYCCVLYIVYMFSNSCSTAVHVSSDIYVDVNGGCGLIHCFG